MAADIVLNFFSQPSPWDFAMTDRVTNQYEFGPFLLDPDEKVLLRSGSVVSLTPKAFDTLAVLVARNGHLVEKDELIKLLWPDSFVEENSLSQNVYLLRKALGEDPAAFR